MSNVYITSECLPALTAQIPHDVFLKSERCHGLQHECNPNEMLQRKSRIGVMRSGDLYCMLRHPTSGSTISAGQIIRF